ncbi:MAG: DcrB-related protein [Candidatus Absconditabacterales bacterium]|nr:DcrB-related protein [Candidatus Absconditabacterales bacterium]
MKKKQILILFVLVLILHGCASNKSNIPSHTNQNTDKAEIFEYNKNNSETIHYENKMENFSLDFPKNRTIKESKFNVIISTPKNDNINENVIIVSQQLQKFLSIAEYYEETILQLEKMLEGFKEIKSTDIVKGELKGKTIIYEHTYQEDENLRLKSLQTFFITSENRVYSINYTATKESFNTHIKGVEKIIDSFKMNK